MYLRNRILIPELSLPPVTTNFSLAATATASSSAGAGFLATVTNDGLRHTNNAWGSGGGWSASTTGLPQWVEHDFGSTKLVREVNIFTLADALNYNTNPALTDTFTLYGIIDFKIQYWNGSAWVNAQVIAGNNKVWRRFTGLSITTTKIRYLCDGGTPSPDSYCRIIELECWG